MSTYDDAGNCSSTLIIGGAYVPFEPCSALFSSALEFKRLDATFLKCKNCESYLDPWDCAIDNFGDLACLYCSGVDLDVLS